MGHFGLLHQRTFTLGRPDECERWFQIHQFGRLDTFQLHFFLSQFNCKRFEIGFSGELSTQELRSESVFTSFHVVYNVECGSEDDQAKVQTTELIDTDAVEYDGENGYRYNGKPLDAYIVE